jgi:hypothetical protein
VEPRSSRADQKRRLVPRFFLPMVHFGPIFSDLIDATIIAAAPIDGIVLPNLAQA